MRDTCEIPCTNVNSVIDARGNEVTGEWDDNRRLQLITPPSPFNSLTTEFDYDANNNRTAIRHATGDVMNPWQTLTTNFNKENKITSVSDPMTHVTSIGYDELRRIESIEDPETRVTETAYDEVSRVETVEDAADNSALTKAYSNNGLLVSVKDARDKETVYEYDGHDRLNTITYPDTTTEEFDWDDNGNLLSFTNRNGDTIAFDYDELNRLRVKTPDNQPEVTFEYDLAGRLESASTSVVANHPESGEFEYFYDTAGRFIREEMPDGKGVEYDLDENGNVIKITYPDSYYVEREYDELNRLKSISLNGSMTPSLEFDYDELSRRRQITADNSVITEYGYRADNQLESIEHTFDGSSVLFEYTFNDAGECIGQEVDDADFMWHPASSGTVSYATAADNNSYPTVGGISQSYNNNGCLTDDGTWTFGYDTENHLISASDGVTSADYLYDPMHRLVQKQVGATKTRFVYGGVQRLADYNGSNDTLQYRYVYGAGLDEVLLRISSGGTVTYLHADRLGSVVATSNNTGSNTAKYKYGPFGETTALTGISHGYTGQRFDSETELYFMKSRFYSSKIGRFNQPDSVGYSAGLNLYQYVHNNPMNLVDPMGTDPMNIAGPTDPGELRRVMNIIGWNEIWGLLPGGGGGAPHQVFIENGIPMITYLGFGKPITQQLINPIFDWARSPVNWDAYGLLGPGLKYLAQRPGALTFDAVMQGIPAAKVGTAYGMAFPLVARWVGRYGERMLATLFPNGVEQVGIMTIPGLRILDNLDGMIAREAKAGLQGLTDRIRDQIAKDADLIAQGLDVEWHFFVSPYTLKGGAWKPLKEALDRAGIAYFIWQ